MHYLRRTGLFICALIVLTPLTLIAAPVLRSGESVTVNETQSVDGDFYAAGGAVTISGGVDGDVYAAGGTVTVNGSIEEDLVVSAGTVQVHGTVGDDVRILGGELTLAGTIEGDVLVMGGVLRVLSTAHIEGDLLFLGGELTLDGEVDGSVSGRSESVRINGVVAGDVAISATRGLTLGDQADIGGGVEYRSLTDIVRAPGSVVVGEVVKREFGITGESDRFSVLPILVLFFTSLVYVFLFRPRLEHFMRRAVATFGMQSLIGFGTLVLTPFLAVLLMVSVIGLPVGIALICMYAFALVASWSLGGVLVGAGLARYFDGAPRVTVKWALLGTLAYAVISYIPYLGTLAIVVATLIVLGTTVSFLFGFLRRG